MTPRSLQWRSVEELNGSAELDELMVLESPEGARQWEEAEGLSRRGFMSYGGATVVAASAALSGCIRKPEEKIVPQAVRPEHRVPGEALHYATSALIGGGVIGLLAKSQDGRPIKVEGNPKHPLSLGATSAFAQAEVLSLYDPDRSRAPKKGGAAASLSDADAGLQAIGEAAKANGGQGLAVLVHDSSSPTVWRLLSELKAMAPAVGLFADDQAAASVAGAAADLVGQQGRAAHWDLSAAKAIVVLGADVLGTEGDATFAVRRFTDGRRIERADQGMNRLYVSEAGFTTTGAMADHRLRLPTARLPELLSAIGSVLVAEGVALPAGAEALAGGLKASSDERVQKFATAIGKDLAKNRGASALIVGERLPVGAHGLAYALNAALQNVGTTLRFEERGVPADVGGLSKLAEAMQAGSVSTLVMLGGNPHYTAPADLQFGAALAKVGTTVHLSAHVDETSAASTWHVPLSHFLESWGDHRGSDGSASIQQPLIAPLFDSRSPVQAALLLLGRGTDELAAVQDTWRARTADASSFDVQWRRWVHDGVIDAAKLGTPAAPVAAPVASVPADAPPAAAAPADPAAAPPVADAAPVAAPVVEAAANPWAAAGAFQWGGVAAAWSNIQAATVGPDAVEVDFVLDSKVLDGRYVNNAWLQELPDPISKITWDNAALINAKTASRLGVVASDLIEVSAGGSKVELPAFIVPGIADDVVVLPLGYGRGVDWRVAKGTGFAVGGLRSAASPWVTQGASLRKTSGKYRVATTQAHGRMEVGLNTKDQVLTSQSQSAEAIPKTIFGLEFKPRPLVREASLAEFGTNPEFVKDDEIMKDESKIKSLWVEPNERGGQQWGMSIDLNLCTGCNACTVACQAENNVSVVGKERVLKGREMHWIRLDRYFTGDVDDPTAVVQPIACMHCENAPCEQVCPVAATTHSDEGLNDIAYNRCIGTRYCANNCPYKVRRYNFFNYSKENTESNRLVVLQRNPDVTVRFRGVVEKCSFCAQRIQGAKIVAKRSGRTTVEDGGIVPACAQVCPAQAIVFGDVNDPETRVSKAKAQPRDYVVLAELNIKPRTSFLAKLRNPNPELQA